MRRDEPLHPIDDARRHEALDELLATPCEMPEGLDERLLAIPDLPRRASWRRIAAAAAAAVVVGVAVAWQVAPGEPAAPDVPEPLRRDRVAVALRYPTETGRAFLEDEGDRVLVTLHRLARDADPAVAVPAIERLGVLARRASLPVLVDVVRRSDRRAAALRAFGALGDASAARVIAPYLDDPDLFPVARDALVAVGGRDAVAALVRALAGAERPAALVAAIGRIRDAAAVPGLLGLLERPELAAGALQALGAEHHRPALLAAARRRDLGEARAAIHAIERLAVPEAVPVLRGLLADGTRRAAAARALAAIDTPEAGAALLGELTRHGVREAFEHAGAGIEAWLLACVEDGDRRERRRLVDLLALCGGDRSVPALGALADDPALAPVVVTALSRIGGPAAVASLEGLAPRSALRRPVLDALASIGSPDAVPALVRLGRSDRALRRPVIAALGRIPHPDAVHAILALDGSVTTRRTTARTLRAMDRDTVVPALVALLEGERAPEARRWLHTVGP